MNQYDRIKRGERGAWVSIIAYLFLAALKIIIAQLTNSQALRADGLNNSTDVVASIAVLIGLKISRKPPDYDHHYGHFRAELIASLVASFIMVSVGLQVILNSLKYIWIDEVKQPSMLAGWVSLASSILMLVVYEYNKRLAKKINSQSLYAASQDNKSDALVSLAAFIGIIGAQIGITWLDPLAGILVGILIVYTAWNIFKNASHTLTDGFEDDTINKIRASIEKDSEIKKVKDIKGRHDGNRIYLDMTIYVDPSITIEHAHKITDRIEACLINKFKVYHTHIHVEPDPNHQSNR